MIAAEAVVFAMPMSPVSRQRAPSATSCSATAMPTSRARTASSRDMAGPVLRSAVPGRTLRTSTPSIPDTSAATPTSTTTTCAPVCAARAFTTAPPAARLATICAVTSCGHGLTPCAWTPWSAATTTTTAGSGSGGGSTPASPASCTETSSSPPSEPCGLVSRSWCSRAAATAPASSGRSAASVRASSPPGTSVAGASVVGVSATRRP